MGCRHGKFKDIEAATGGVLKSFTKFTGKHLCQILFFNNVDSGTGVFQ